MKVKVWGQTKELRALTVSARYRSLAAFMEDLSAKLQITSYILSFNTGSGIRFHVDFSVFKIDPDEGTTDFSSKVSTLGEMHTGDHVCLCWDPLLVNDLAWRCMNCLKLNTRKRSKCFVCKTSHPVQRAIANATKEVQAKKKVRIYRWRCSRCGSKNNQPENAPFCNVCKVKIPANLKLMMKVDLDAVDSARKTLHLEMEKSATQGQNSEDPTERELATNAKLLRALQKIKKGEVKMNKAAKSYDMMGFVAEDQEEGEGAERAKKKEAISNWSKFANMKK